MEKNLAKNYNPKEFEDRIYEMWEMKVVLELKLMKTRSLLQS